MRISFVNGKFLPHEECFVHIEDRGFQFADGVYEVILYKNKKLIDANWHFERFFRSLREFNISHDFSQSDLEKIMIDLFEKNKMSEGTCYMQITRGVNNRLPWVPKNISPTIVATVSPAKKVSPEEFERGFSVITFEDIRWLRCDIKSVALIASSMMNQKAKDAGADDAVLVRNGIVTEASFANIFITDENDTLITKPADNLILCGITRNRILDLAKKNGIKTEEKNFTVDELLKAKEVFLTSSSLILRPVVKVNDNEIGDGKTGKISRRVSDLYQQFIS